MKLQDLQREGQSFTAKFAVHGKKNLLAELSFRRLEIFLVVDVNGRFNRPPRFGTPCF